jgi:hypothetical protein
MARVQLHPIEEKSLVRALLDAGADGQAWRLRLGPGNCMTVELEVVELCIADGGPIVSVWASSGRPVPVWAYQGRICSIDQEKKVLEMKDVSAIVATRVNRATVGKLVERYHALEVEQAAWSQARDACHAQALPSDDDCDAHTRDQLKQARELRSRLGGAHQ